MKSSDIRNYLYAQRFSMAPHDSYYGYNITYWHCLPCTAKSQTYNGHIFVNKIIQRRQKFLSTLDLVLVFNMNTFLFLSLIFNITIIFSPCYLSYEIFVITRKSERVQPGGDEFIVSTNYCRDKKPDCELFRASRGPSQDAHCACVCNDGSKTTLVFQNGTFRCISNSLLRASQGRLHHQIQNKNLSTQKCYQKLLTFF